MTVADFTTLSLPEQLEFLYAEGIFLAKRQHAGEWAILYQINRLYVEICYKQYRGVVRHIRCSTHTDILDTYLDGISLQGLLPDQG